MNKVIVTTEQRFIKSSEGVYLVKGSETNQFFTRYLETFDKVLVVARIMITSEIDESLNIIDDPRIEFVELDDFKGIIGFIKSMLVNNITHRLKQATTNDRIVLRLPGLVGTIVWIACMRMRLYYACEVVTDPKSALTRDAIGFNSFGILSLLGVNLLKIQTYFSLANSYVTKSYLQRIYRNKLGNHFSYSSINIDSNILKYRKKIYKNFGDPNQRLVLVSIGRMNKPFKGVDTLLYTCQILINKGIDVSLIIVGGGSMLNYYKEMCVNLNLSSNVTFTGEITNVDNLYRQLSSCDFYISASRREGLPRSVIEARILGLPCIATDVAGTFEVVESFLLVSVNSPEQMAQKILWLKNNREIMQDVVERGLDLLEYYNGTEQGKKRREFFEFLINK